MAYTNTTQGVQTSYTELAANQMPDVDKVLYLLEPYQTPLFTKYFFQNKPSDAVINGNAKFSWFEDEYFPYITTVTNITGGATSEDNITVGSHNPFAVGDVFLITATEQLVYVDSIASDEIDITILDGSTNITATTTGHMIKVGSRNHEYGTPRTSTMTNEIEKFNYCTIFKETITTSGRQEAGDHYTNGKTHAEQVQKKILEMKQQYERNFWFSTSAISLVDSSTYRMTFGQGALGRITTNKVPYTGTLDEPQFDAFLAQVLQKGSPDKDLYCGANAYNAVSKFVKDKYQVVNSTASTYGVHVTQYVAPLGKRITLIWNPVFEGKFLDYIFALDPKGIKMRHMANDNKGSRKFRMEDFDETNGIDGTSTQIMSDLGIQIANEETHGILYKA